jgi:hypothetical protein
VSSLRERIDFDGYAVAEGVVEQSHIDALLALAESMWGFRLDEPATWGRWPDDYRPAVWGHQAQWDIRQHPPVHRAFAEVYGREDLWVSQDGLAVKPPGSPGLPLHWDVHPDIGEYPRVLQGVLYLTDVTAEQGAFRCLPTLFRDRDGWVKRHPDGPIWDIDAEGHDVVPVCGKAGDLVLFDTRLPHSNGDNVADTPRVVQYVTMWPPNPWGQQAESHQAIWRTGRAHPDHRVRKGWDHAELWPPAQLTPLGRRLLALEPWPDATV